MSDSAPHNPDETSRTLVSDQRDQSKADDDQWQGPTTSPNFPAADETVIQSESSVQDVTLHNEQPDDAAASRTAPLNDASRTKAVASHGDDGNPSAEAAFASDASTAESDRPLHSENGATAARASNVTEETVVGSSENGADSSFSVEPTLAGPSDSHPSATAPNRDDKSRESYVSVEATIAGDATSAKGPRAIPERETAKPKIGRFEIVKVLGQGAFGTVYLAHDPHLDRKVAVKVAKTGVLSGKQDVDRFMREARSAAQLRHPHIVPVYEFERLPHSSFIAYEYVEGTTLGHLMKERKTLSCEQAADYIAKIAAALDYAHSLGIVHRDMKPENVLLDRAGEPHIADFGLARRDDGDTLRTREGMFMGTPSYMSPEQAGGKAHLADGRSDIWSLGVMLHEMLTGVRPFRGTVTEVLVAVQNEEPSPLRQIDKSLPRDLETICQKCLTKDLDQRYQRAQDLADELERWRNGIPIEARPISLPHRAWRWAKRNPDIAGLIGAVLAIFLIGAIVSTWFGIAAKRSERQVLQTRAERALTQLSALETAVPASVPNIIGELQASREDITPRLKETLASDDLKDRPRARLLMAQIILNETDGAGVDPEALEDVRRQLLVSDAAELIMLTDLIDAHGYRDDVESPLWRTVQRENSDSPRRFRALAALAALDSDLPVWSQVSSDFVAQMLAMNPIGLSGWLPALQPIREELEGPLTSQFMSGGDRDVRGTAAYVLAALFDDSLETLIALIPEAEPAQLAPLLVALRPHAEEIIPRLNDQLRSLQEAASDEPDDAQLNARITNAAVSLLRLGSPENVWPLLHASPDQEVRTRLIHAAPLAGVPWRTISSRLGWETNPEAIAALCLMLGEYEGELLPGDRDQLTVVLRDLFATHPHPGVHSAAEWTLKRWGKGAEIDETKEAIATDSRPPERRWHVDSQGWTFAVFDGPTEFDMGSAESTPYHQENQQRHRRLIPRTFGIATREVTMADYLKFREEHPERSYAGASTAPDCPIVALKWIDAAMYCRWLSEQAGMKEHEMCYPPLDVLEEARNKFGVTIKLPDDLLDRTGYRLPTAAEWEYASGAGTQTAWSFGNSEELLDEFAWYDDNTSDHTEPVGLLKPNSWGLFDVYGNASERCQSFYFDEYLDPNAAGLMIDGVDSRNERGSVQDLRGGSYFRPAEASTTAFREYLQASHFDFDTGFRIARTYRRGSDKAAGD